MEAPLPTFAAPMPSYAPLDSLVAEITTCGSHEEIPWLLRQTARSLGSTAAYFASFERKESCSSPFRLCLACDPLWGLEYEREESFANDPWLAHCRHSSEPVRASQIRLHGEAAAAVVRLAAAFGIRSAIVAPAPAAGHGDLLGMLVLGHREEGHFEQSGDGLVKVAARALAMELRERLAALERRRILAGTHLSPLDLVLLRLARQGLSSKAIGKRTALSATAVDMRFYRLNSKLRCTDRKSSSHLAAICGLI